MSSGCVRRGWPLIARGVGLGCLASLVASLVFGALAVGSFGLRVLRPAYGPAPSWQLQDLLYFGLLVAGLGLVAFRCAAAPGALGGALIALAVYALAPRTQRLPAVGTLIGFLVGGLAVIPAVLLSQALSEGSVWEWDLFWGFYLAAAGVAAASGGWVGMALARYEVRRRACLRDE